MAELKYKCPTREQWTQWTLYPYIKKLSKFNQVMNTWVHEHWMRVCERSSWVRRTLLLLHGSWSPEVHLPEGRGFGLPALATHHIGVEGILGDGPFLQLPRTHCWLQAQPSLLWQVKVSCSISLSVLKLLGAEVAVSWNLPLGIHGHSVKPALGEGRRLRWKVWAGHRGWLHTLVGTSNERQSLNFLKQCACVVVVWLCAALKTCAGEGCGGGSRGFLRWFLGCCGAKGFCVGRGGVCRIYLHNKFWFWRKECVVKMAGIINTDNSSMRKYKTENKVRNIMKLSINVQENMQKIGKAKCCPRNYE